ncbi:MAG: hypothetical protein WEA09_07325 [Gemmatimonadota bacterium]
MALLLLGALTTACGVGGRGADPSPPVPRNERTEVVPHATPSLGEALFGPLGVRRPLELFYRSFLPFHAYFNPLEASGMMGVAVDGRLPDMSSEGRQGLADGYRQWVRRLREEYPDPPESWDWDRLLLEAELETRVLMLDSVRIWERDPTLYVEITAQALTEPAWMSSGSSSVRLRLLTARARVVPNLLSEGLRNIRPAHPLLVDGARQLGERLLALLEEGPESWVPGAVDGPDLWAAREGVARAAQGLEAFLAGLDASGPANVEGGRGAPPVGTIVLARLLRNGAGLDRPILAAQFGAMADQELLEAWLEEQKTLTRHRLEELRAAALEAAMGLDGSRDPQEVLRSPRLSTHREAGGDLAPQALLDDLRAWIRVVDLLPSDRPILPTSLSSIPLGPWLPAPSHGVLMDAPRVVFLGQPSILGPSHPAADPQMEPLESTLLLQGPTGWGATAEALRSPILEPGRRIFPSRVTHAGWPLYSRGVLAGEGYGLERGFNLLHIRGEVRAQALFLASMAYHTGASSTQELLTDLEAQGWWSAEEARDAMARAVANPLAVLEGPSASAIKALVEEVETELATTGGSSPGRSLIRAAFLDSGLPPWAARSLIPVLLGSGQ